MASNYTTQQLQDLITSTALQYGVDPALALAVAKTESNFNPNAVNTSNSNGTVDYGVMQINSSNLSALGITDPTDPVQNVTAGIQLLAQLSQQYGGNTQQILWAYNAGPGAVANANLPASTSNYIQTVMDAMTQFGGVPDTSSTTDTSSGFQLDSNGWLLIGIGSVLAAWLFTR